VDTAQARLEYERALEAWRAASRARHTSAWHERLSSRWPGYSTAAHTFGRRAADLDLEEDAAYEAFIRARDAYVSVIRGETA